MAAIAQQKQFNLAALTAPRCDRGNAWNFRPPAGAEGRVRLASRGWADEELCCAVYSKLGQRQCSRLAVEGLTPAEARQAVRGTTFARRGEWLQRRVWRALEQSGELVLRRVGGGRRAPVERICIVRIHQENGTPARWAQLKAARRDRANARRRQRRRRLRELRDGARQAAAAAMVAAVVQGAAGGGIGEIAPTLAFRNGSNGENYRLKSFFLSAAPPLGEGRPPRVRPVPSNSNSQNPYSHPPARRGGREKVGALDVAEAWSAADQFELACGQRGAAHRPACPPSAPIPPPEAPPPPPSAPPSAPPPPAPPPPAAHELARLIPKLVASYGRTQPGRAAARLGDRTWRALGGEGGWSRLCAATAAEVSERAAALGSTLEDAHPAPPPRPSPPAAVPIFPPPPEPAAPPGAAALGWADINDAFERLDQLIARRATAAEARLAMGPLYPQLVLPSGREWAAWLAPEARELHMDWLEEAWLAWADMGAAGAAPRAAVGSERDDRRRLARLHGRAQDVLRGIWRVFPAKQHDATWPLLELCDMGASADLVAQTARELAAGEGGVAQPAALGIILRGRVERKMLEMGLPVGDWRAASARRKAARRP